MSFAIFVVMHTILSPCISWNQDPFENPKLIFNQMQRFRCPSTVSIENHCLVVWESEIRQQRGRREKYFGIENLSLDPIEFQYRYQSNGYCGQLW